MSLKTWQENGWLKPHKSSAEEIGNLFGVVERDLKDSTFKEISADMRFVAAYNAALKLCTILLYAEGYRPDKGQSNHYRSIEALPLILGDEAKADARYLDRCRVKRNAAEYDYVNAASESEADELREFAVEFRGRVEARLKANNPVLFPKQGK